jgi:UDP-N-acetylenolpyruvoylglucosamine reductase
MICSAEMAAELRQVVGAGAVVRERESMASRTTLKVGGVADCYVEPGGEEELSRVVQWCEGSRVPYFLLGRGSNLLVRDGGIRGVVISLAGAAFSRVEERGGVLICGAGAMLKVVVQVARDAGHGGLEFLEGIPGSLGGALRMNAGAMGSWMYDVVRSVRAMDRAGVIREVERSDLDVVYRSCNLFRDHIALGAVLAGEPMSPGVITERRKDFNNRRWSSQPAAASAGCIFKNPETMPAGQMIDRLGLKGTRVGGAVVSDKHANFIVNQGGASAGDVLGLIELVRERALRECGVRLETEVQIVGEDAAGEGGGR